MPTNDNPADLASRGLQPSQIVGNKLWFNGPSWLKKEESEWPELPPKTKLTTEQQGLSDDEEKPHTVLVVVQDELVMSIKQSSLLKKCSTLLKLKRISAYVLRFIQNSRNRDNKIIGNLTRSELLEAQDIWIKCRQSVNFAKEINACQSNELLPKGSLSLACIHL